MGFLSRKNKAAKVKDDPPKPPTTSLYVYVVCIQEKGFDLDHSSFVLLFT